MLSSKSSPLVFFINGKKVVDNAVNPEWTLLTYLRLKLKLCGTKLGCAEGGCGACTVMLSRFDRTTQKIVHLAVNACLTPICVVHGASVTTIEGIGSVAKGLHPAQERLAKSHGSQCGFCTPGIVMSMYALLRENNLPSMEDVEVAFQGNLCRCTGYRPILEGYKTLTSDGMEGCCGKMNGGCCMDSSKEMNDSYHTAVNGIPHNGINGDIYDADVVRSNGINGDIHDADVVRSNGINGDIHDGKKLPIHKQSEESCCGKVSDDFFKKSVETTFKTDSTLFDISEFKPYDPTQEPIFPPELLMDNKLETSSIAFFGDRVSWYRPATLENLLDLKHNYPNAKLVVGNSEIGVEVKFKNMHYPVIIQPNLVSELLQIEEEEKGVRFGSSVTLNTMDDYFRSKIKTLPTYKTRIFAASVEILRWFAGKQIRNTASIAGNIVTGSPISDMNPVLLAANAELVLQSKDGGTRTVYMDHTFFTGYRRNVIKPDEVLVSVFIPYTSEDEYFWAYKQAKRRDDDIAITNAAMRVVFEKGTNIIKDVAMSFGGMAPITVLARKTAAAMIGKQWEDSLVDEVCQYLIDDLPLSPTAPGGFIQFRRSLTLSFFFKFYLMVTTELSKRLPNVKPIPEKYKSAIDIYHREVPKSLQLYQIVPENQPDYDLVGKPVMHTSGLKQATGEAVYIDDIPRLEDEAYLGLVLSSKAHARILSIDTTEAMKIQGVIDFVSAEDVPEERRYVGGVIHDEEVFASEKVTCVGQVIAGIVAIDQATAQRAAKLVKVTYEEIHPIIVTFQDALKYNSFYEGFTRDIVDGDFKKGLEEADHVLEGEMYLCGQEHFYLETQACIAVPKPEDGEMELFCSTQNPNEIQLLTAHVLGVQQNKINIKVKRLGGGFGGKETAAMKIAGPLAVAARKNGIAVRCMLDRDEDMALTGTRHPFYNKYKVGFKKDGRITALYFDIYNNAGNSLDLSCGVLERSVFHSDNSYKISNFEVHGKCCRTNIPSNTAFRGFGGPQGMMFCENVFDIVAEFLKLNPVKLREMHMYKEGDQTHYGQTLDYCTMGRCWDECYSDSQYDIKKAEVEEFNRNNRFKKRGISIIPTKFGIAFTVLFLNQAGALVLVYRDGSVLISHGGTEMGQGLHTKMIQVASRALKCSVDRIHISETATDKVPNTSPTAASAGSDLNGMAVLNACTVISERLEPFRLQHPEASWDEIVKMAYFNRVGLSAAGYYRTPDIGFDFKTRSGNAFNYYTYGAACSVVEIDCLTGDHEVKNTHIVMDVGESLNPAIDIGQIEGGFMQGYGLFTLEELQFSPSGFLLTKGPGMYKLPGFGDIPLQFNVALLRGAPNKKAVFSSKAIGEPPLFLASSVFFAIKDAIRAARRENGIEGLFHLDSPATAEKIRIGCEDRFTRKFPMPEKGTYIPWTIGL